MCEHRKPSRNWPSRPCAKQCLTCLLTYFQVQEVPGVKIFHFGGAMHFANAEFFRNKLDETLGFTVKQIRRAMKKAIKKGDSQDSLQAAKVGGIDFFSFFLPNDRPKRFWRKSSYDGCIVQLLRVTSDE